MTVSSQPGSVCKLLLFSLVTWSANTLAVPLYWDGTSSNFSLNTAWSTVNNATTPDPAAIPGVADVATFRITTLLTNQIVDLNGNQSVQGLATSGLPANSNIATTIQAGGTNRVLTIGNSGINHASGQFTIGSVTAGQQVDVQLSSNQNWTSASSISGGGTAGITVLNGVSSATVGTKVLTLTGANGSASIQGNISDGAGAVSIVKDRTSAVNGTTWTLGGTNTYSGTTTVTSGILQVNNNAALGSTAGGTIVQVNTGSGVSATLALTSGRVITGETLTINGSGEQNVGALTNVSGTTEWAGTINLNTNVVVGTTTFARIGAAANSQMIISGVIQNGTGQDLNISGNGATGTGGIVTLSGANTYTGGTNVIRGTLRIGANNSLPVGTILDVRSASGAAETATFDLNNFNQTVGGLQNSGGAAVATTVTNSGGSTRTLTINNAAARVYSGVISGNLNLTKTGAGTQTISGVNTYTGKTTVNGGTLAIGASGSIANSNEVALGSGIFDVSAKGAPGLTLGASQKLSGSGSVTGNIAINGNLAIGNSPGAITFNNNLTLGGTSVSDFEFTDTAFAPGTFDLAQGTGDTVSFGGTLNLSFSGGTYANASTVNIFAGFATYSGNFSTVNFSGLGVGQSATFDSLTGIVTVVPEPGSGLLIAGGLLGLVLRRRRR